MAAIRTCVTRPADRAYLPRPVRFINEVAFIAKSGIDLEPQCLHHGDILRFGGGKRQADKLTLTRTLTRTPSLILILILTRTRTRTLPLPLT